VAVYQNGRGGFIDPFTGRVAISLRFDLVDGFSCGRAAVRENLKWGFIDKSGAFAVRPQYSQVSGFSEGLAAVAVATGSEPGAPSKWAYIDTDGKTVIRPQFGSAGNFSEGLASASRYVDGATIGKEGYIDRSGIMVIEPKFDYACEFHEGLARVCIRPKNAPREDGEDKEAQPGGKWGFIDKTGQFVVKPRFSRADDFIRGRAAVFDGKEEYEVDAKGVVYLVKREKKK
jgi:hypothetical protein